MWGSWTASQCCRAARRASSARARRGRMLATGLIILPCLAALSVIDPGAIGQEVVGQDRWRMAMEPTVLSVDQEKEKAAKPGSDFKECANGCPVMIVIPAGKFIMGSPENESDRSASEGPQHEVTVARPFAVSKFEVTFEEWDACVAAAACPRVTDHWGRGKMPVINVSWGDDPRMGNANCDGCGSQWDLRQTAPVGSFKPNALGLYDMHGNVWEWVEDSWHENYDRAPTDGSAWLQDGDPSFRVVRGGSWRNESELVRAAVRVRRHTKVQFDTLGLRVARTIGP